MKYLKRDEPSFNVPFNDPITIGMLFDCECGHTGINAKCHFQKAHADDPDNNLVAGKMVIDFVITLLAKHKLQGIIVNEGGEDQFKIYCPKCYPLHNNKNKVN